MKTTLHADVSSYVEGMRAAHQPGKKTQARRTRAIWITILGLTAAAVCFAYATWAVITATAAW